MKPIVWLLCTAIVFGISRASAGEQAMPVYIPSEPLGQALLDFGVRLNVSIFTDPTKLPKGVRSPVIAGIYTPSEALTLILSQTTLRFEYLDTIDTFRVFPNECSNSSKDLEHRIGQPPC